MIDGVIALCVYLIGVYFHRKIIKVSIQDKGMTWKLDVTNSCIVLFFYMNVISIRIIRYFVEDIHAYTGEWFCYYVKVIMWYGILFIFGHSFIVALLKNIIIVHWKKARIFGKEKIIEIFFWLNLFHPMVKIILELIIRPDFFWDENAQPQVAQCFGSRNNSLEAEANPSFDKINHFCDFVKPNQTDYLKYIAYGCKMISCEIGVTSYHMIMWNFLELFLYCQIFRLMRR